MSEQDKDFKADSSGIGTSAVTQKEVEDESKSSYAEYELPLGYLDAEGNLFDKVVVREMTGEEEDIFASRKMSVIKKINMVLKNCIVSLDNKEGKKRDVELEEVVAKLPSIDRMFLLVRIRQQTYGDIFKFEDVCDNDVNEKDGTVHKCGHRQLVMVNLRELDVKYPVDKKKRIFECTLNSGKKVVFKIMTGMEDAQLAVGDEDKTVSDIMLMRVITINGKPPMLHDLKKMSLKDRKKLRGEMGKADNAGMDSEIEIQCPKCSRIKKDTLRYDSADFFYPEGL